MAWRTRVKEIIDPGYGVRYKKQTKRVINKDGSFNVVRKGAGFSSRNIYQELIKMSWARFLVLNFLFIFLMNILFAFLYLWIGLSEIEGESPGTGFYHDFTQAFFSHSKHLQL